MRLTIRSFSPNDVGTYHCVSTNSLGRAEGTLRLYGMNFVDISCNFEAEFTSIYMFIFELSFPEIKINPGAVESDRDEYNSINGTCQN